MSIPELAYPLRGINLKDATLFENAVPHDVFETLRREAPVYWNEEPEPEEPGFWAVTKYEDVVRISKDPKLFSSAVGGHQISYGAGAEFTQANAAVLGNMIAMDPPEHNVYRKLVSRHFTPRSVAAMEETIRRRTTEILDRAIELRECDFVSEVAAELPLFVLAELLGVPAEDRRQLFEWSNRLVGIEDPDFNATPLDALPYFAQLFSYGQELFAERRKNPTEDLMGLMASGQVDGEEIEQGLLSGFFLLLVIAGNETTRNTISGGMLALIEHPEQRRVLAADPSRIPVAVEEMLRWVSPVIHFRRTATADTEIRGQKIRKGDKVVLWYPAANRDEDVFANPQVFDIAREPNEHVAFGEGQHFCLGARLAQLQLRVMFEELLRRAPDLELVGPVRRMRSYFISGIKQMPVRFR